MVAQHMISLLSILTFMTNSAISGFLNSPLSYNSAFASPPYLPYDAPPSSHFAAPLPVDFFNGPSQALPVAPITVNSYEETTHHTYAAPPVPFIKSYHSGLNPFRTYSALPSKFRFAGSPHYPSVYGVPLPYELSSSAASFGAPNAIVKFGPPITTTTTTYSTAASGAVAPVLAPFAAPYAGRNGW